MLVVDLGHKLGQLGLSQMHLLVLDGSPLCLGKLQVLLLLLVMQQVLLVLALVLVPLMVLVLSLVLLLAHIF